MTSDNTGPERTAERIYFGHQSVGADILDGVRKLKSVEVRQADGRFDTAALYESEIGENEKPLSKIDAFSALMAERGDALDAAMFKFCYIDFGADTDVTALFERYAHAMDAIAAAHPQTTIAHVTVPLTVVQKGVKGWLRQLSGRGRWGERENKKRHEFNTLLRARYTGKAPIFDLADLESHRDNGQAVTHGDVPMLYGLYTRDGGHLSDEGKAKIAPAFVSFLRSLPKRR